MHPLIVGITADDLTGAAEAAGAFARAGAPVGVSLDLQAPVARDERRVFAVTTGTRGLPAEEVFDVVGESASNLRMAGATFVFKKLDSNLRGGVGTELAAIFATVGGPLLVAPAFPARGCTTREGLVLLDGVPVSETEMVQDPEAPARHSHLPTLLAEQAPDLLVAQAALEVVRQGPAALRRLLRPEAVLVADAETEEDLDLLAEAVLLDPPLRVAAGSGGLAAALARRLFGPAGSRPWPAQRTGPLLALMAGSSHALDVQIAHADTASDVAVVPFSCERLNREEQPIPSLNAALTAALAALLEGRDTLLYASGRLPQVERPMDLVVEHLAHLAFVAVRRGAPKGLLVGGGAVAQAVLSVLGARAIEIDDQPASGMAAGIISAGDLAGLPVVLKPGAAGGPSALVDLFAYLGQRAAALDPAT